MIKWILLGVFLGVILIAMWPRSEIRGDLNSDGFVDFEDHAIMRDHLFRYPTALVDTSADMRRFDLNEDGELNIEDLVELEIILKERNL